MSFDFRGADFKRFFSDRFYNLKIQNQNTLLLPTREGEAVESILCYFQISHGKGD